MLLAPLLMCVIGWLLALPADGEAWQVDGLHVLLVGKDDGMIDVLRRMMG